MTKKVLILGGSGYVGRMVLTEALARGYEVTALLRSPDVVTDAKVRKVKGDALDPQAVREAVKGQDAVIHAIGLSTSGGKRGGNLKRGEKTTVFSETAKVLVDAMKADGVKRLIVMSNVGVGDSAAAVPFVAKKIIFPLFLPFLLAIFEDKEKMEPIVANSGLDWTLARFNGITGDKPKGTRKVAMDGKVAMTITVPDAAKFLVDQVEDEAFIKKAPSISN